MIARGKLPWAVLPLLALALLAGGCGPPPIDPGPDPARVALVIKKVVSGQQVGQAMWGQGIWGPFPGSWARFDSFLGPFWSVTAEQKQPDGAWRPLPLAPGQKDEEVGYVINIRRVFMTSPGPQELRFGLEAYIQRSWQERRAPVYIRRYTDEGSYLERVDSGWDTRFQTIDLLLERIDQFVSPSGGQEIELEPFK